MACHGHVNSCPSHSGYVGPRLIVFGNPSIDTGDTIDLENEVNQLLNELNIEAVRRSVLGKSPISLSLTDPVKTTQIRQIRDLFLHITNTTAVVPYTNTQINTGVKIMANTYEDMKDKTITDTNRCICQCNYSCTCNCNYCTCQCNYCTCQCNYGCTCDCNYSYSCTCNCNHSYNCKCNCNFSYACTCVCNYSCKCNCAYGYCPVFQATGCFSLSDMRLKTEIVYF